MEKMQLTKVGAVHVQGEDMYVKLNPAYLPALQGLEGFSHLVVLWWFSDCDIPEARGMLETPQPYKGAPDVMGTFATRGPCRPNPIAMSVVEVLDVDYEKGIVRVPYIDAEDGTPVLGV